MTVPKLRRIDCVLYTVPEDDLAEASDHYETVLGLEKCWERPEQVGFRMDDHEEGVCEIVLSTDTGIPDGEVQYLVDDVQEAAAHFARRGCEIVRGPTAIPVGHVATIRNEWSHEFDLLDFED